MHYRINIIFIFILFYFIKHVQPYKFKAENSVEIKRTRMKIRKPFKRTEIFLPPVCGYKVQQCNKSTSFRTFDGSCNNLLNADWGVPNSTYLNLLPPAYGNRIYSPRIATDNTSLPSSRKLRTLLFPTGQNENDFWNMLAMIWGQFMAHDMSLMSHLNDPNKCCTPDGEYERGVDHFCFPVKIPSTDRTMGASGINCMNFTRTITNRDLGCSLENEPAKQINTVTSWMDLSNVYGLSKEICDKLRTFQNGKLITETRNNCVFPPSEDNLNAHCKCNLPGEKVCYKTGDSRSNQNPQLILLQILFVREHNRIADELKKVNPEWDDEMLFQQARRILIAIYQKISYYEWLPIILGEDYLLQKNITYTETGFVNDYDPNLNPGISNEHAQAAYRAFHSNIVGTIYLYNENRERLSSFFLRDTLNRPQMIEEGDNVHKLIMGMLVQFMEGSDHIIVDDVADHLFACNKEFGIDLKAHDIQRDRDHGLNYYNQYREYCGLKYAENFNDYSDHISSNDIKLLKSQYKSYKDVDLTVGGGLEKLVKDAQVGPTFLCILSEQFLRTRKSDRFWFENASSGLTLDQLSEIRKMTISRFICDNGDGVKEIPEKGFTLPLENINLMKNCSEIPSMNFTAWKQ